MNLYVCLKQVFNTEAKIIIKNNVDIDNTGVKLVLNPFDEYAIEEAVKLKEKETDATVIAVCLGPETATEAIRTALAMGADRAIHIHISDNEILDSDLTARALAKAIKSDSESSGGFDMIFTGKKAVDSEASQVPIRLANYLDVPVTTNIISFEHTKDMVVVGRDIDEGARELIEMKLPAVVTAAKGLNTPRYATLPNIVKAKKKEIKEMTLQELGISSLENNQQVVSYAIPPENSETKLFEGEPEEVVEQFIRVIQEDKVF